MVLNSGAVDAVGGGTAVECVVVSTVGAGNSAHIGAGDAGGGLQAEVRGVSLGDIVLAIGVVGDTVGVENNDACGLHCSSNSSQSCIGAGVELVFAAGCLCDGVSFVLVLIGEAGVIAVVGSDEVYILRCGGAALSCIGNGLNYIQALLRVVTGLVTELRRITADDAFGGFPGEEVAVTVDGAFYISIGLFDKSFDLVGQLCIVLSSDSSATLGNNILILVGVDLIPNICVDDFFRLLGDLDNGLVLGLSCGSKDGKQAADHCNGQDHSHKSHDVLFHSDISFHFALKEGKVPPLAFPYDTTVFRKSK